MPSMSAYGQDAHFVPVRMLIYRTAIPMHSFEHAAATRNEAESVVIHVHYQDGSAAWGQTLPRPYVTGETMDSVVDDLQEIFWPLFAGKCLTPAGDLAAMDVPHSDGGRCISAAACAMDLATIRRVFGRLKDISSEVLSALAGRARPRPRIDAVASGVLGSSDPDKTVRHMRQMRWYGLKQFKLKLGFGEEIDERNLDVVCRSIGSRMQRGTRSLRVDANGAWDVDTTPQRTRDLAGRGICAVEQPVYCSAEEMVELADRCHCPLIADEGLLNDDDARTLIQAGPKLWWNIRLCKNGGLVNSLHLARMAAEADVPFVAGCMVGEACILSAAQRRMLQMGPAPRFVEGNWGRWLMHDDLTDRAIRFRWGGRIGALPGPELGVVVDPAKVFRYSERVATCDIGRG